MTSEYFWLPILVGIAVSGTIAWLFKYPWRPEILKTYEKNYNFAFSEMMNQVNSFDSQFKRFWTNFEEKFGKIHDLPEGNFLPSTFGLTVDETNNPNEHSEFAKIEKWQDDFDEQDVMFKEIEKTMTEIAGDVFQHIDKNQTYLEQELTYFIKSYLNDTLFYLSWFRNGWNYTDVLRKRAEYARQIIKILKSKKSFKDRSNLDEFIKEWERDLRTERE